MEGFIEYLRLIYIQQRDKLVFDGLISECKIQNAECKMKVFSSKMILIMGVSPYHNSAFCIFHFAFLHCLYFSQSLTSKSIWSAMVLRALRQKSLSVRSMPATRAVSSTVAMGVV